MSEKDAITFKAGPDGTVLVKGKDGIFRPEQTHTNWARLAALTEEQIEEWSQTDPDHPGTDDAFWATAKIEQPGKEAISIKLDNDVLSFFREQGRGYQTRINAVLRHYMEAQKKAG